MYLNTLDVKLTPRTDTSPYNVEINESTLEILKLVLEFRLATTCHISRFVNHKEQSRYIYTKLRRMWQAGLLESFKVFSGTSSSLFYMLSKKGVRVLAELGHCEPYRLKNYPAAKTLLSWGLFKHEAQIIELASLESLNVLANLTLSFLGEESSQAQDYINDKPVEALTPDYTAVYKTNENQYLVYTEFERTKKSNEALLNKIQRYLDFLRGQDMNFHIVRLVFQTPTMERAFWLNIFTNRPSLLQLNLVTTHLELLTDAKQFLEPVYTTEQTVLLSKDGFLKAEVSQRIKLLPFL